MPRILLNGGEPMRFNMPRRSRHELIRTRFFGGQRRVWRPLGGIAVWRRHRDYDGLHTYNHIPFTRHPWIVTFESTLPRTMGWHQERVRDVLRRRLVQPNCLRIIAISQYARRRFERQSRDWAEAVDALAKTDVLLPNVFPVAAAPRRYRPGDVLHLAFIGREWARKGGVVAGRLAREAARRHLPVHIHIVSTLRFGYADDPRVDVYAADLRLVTEGKNVTFHGPLTNAQVHQLLDRSHVSLLPTVADTFGFSVLEGFAHGCPAIVSNVGAMPEVVSQRENGFVLQLPLDSTGTWIHASKRLWPLLDEAWTSLAQQGIDAVERIVDGDVSFESLSDASIKRLRERHDPQRATAYIDALYGQMTA